jgi:hypothetical protein
VEFAIESLERDITTNQDNMYKVRGGKFKKYGITGYEAVEENVNRLLVEAGQEYDVGQLPLKQPWDCSGYGWVAVAERPPGEQYPKKVVDVKAGN